MSKLLTLTLAAIFLASTAIAQVLDSTGVARMQQFLSNMGYPTAVDGAAGPATRQSLSEFYADAGILGQPRIDGDTLLTVLQWHDRGFRRPARSATSTPSPARPSFDCAEAGTTVERTICGNPQLARLDADLARTYQGWRSRLNAEGRATLLDEQRAWLRTRDRCGEDVGCLVSAYEVRLRDLAGS
jgi:hypothetical protein